MQRRGFSLCALVSPILFVGLVVLGVPVSALLTPAVLTAWVLMLVFLMVDRRGTRDASNWASDHGNHLAAARDRDHEPKVREHESA
jgi:hypothetical protein